MKTLAAGVALLGVWVTVGSHSADTGAVADEARDAIRAAASAVAVVTSPAAATDAAPTDAAPGVSSALPAVSSEALTVVVRTYCQVCHNDQLMTGNLSLVGFDVDRADESVETAERMIRKLRAGMMPPPGMPRPSGDTLLALVETLESVVDSAAATDPNPGSRRFQRLNRAEYERVIKDLLDIEVDAGIWLPSDTYLGNFDNLSAAQGLSTTLLEGYLRAAAEISRLAVGNPNARSATATYKTALEASQHAWDHVEGAPYGTRGGLVVNHDFPVDGEYVFSVGTFLGRGTMLEDIDISIDGEGIALLGIEHAGVVSAPLETEHIFVRAGQHRVSAAFVRRIEGPYEDRLSPHEWSLVGGTDSDNWANYGITVLPHLRQIVISGPHSPGVVSETASRERVFTCRPMSLSEERPCAESIISNLASRAYRRPVTAADLAGLLSFYESGGEEGGFEIGVRTALQGILASPSFVFRLEEEPEAVAPGETYPLSDLALASRLSFFLWGTLPDAELLEFANAGRLTAPGGLERQVERMLEDPRSEALATRFASQWLRLQDLVKVQPEPYLYPDFNRQLAEAMRRETEMLFYDIVRRDGSVLDLFTADYTFLNDRLARHYGIPFSGGSEFQRVEYPNADRGGLLGQGSILVLTSLADRTSPVLRGKWVMEVLLGTPPPPPPPDVPTLDETAATENGVFLTTRQRMEKHRANPVCMACHQFMDPIGLALDNFDVTGQWRIRENGRPLDTRGTFYDGTPISTPEDLRNVLLKRPTPLLRNFTDNMFAYAMGRRVEYYDQASIRAIVKEAEVNDYRMSSFVLGVAKSDAFRMTRPDVPARQSREDPER
jgi:cytochrome c5